MTETKPCFGQCANLCIRYRDRLKQHFLHMDEAKLKECDACPLFPRCAFLRNNEVMRDLLRLLDEQGRDTHPRIG